MILFKNLVALAVAFIVAVIAVVVFEWAGGLIWPPESSGDIAAIASRGLAAFIGGLIVVVVAISGEMALALVFGLIFVIFEIVVLYSKSMPAVNEVAFNIMYLVAAYFGAQIGLSFFKSSDDSGGE